MVRGIFMLRLLSSAITLSCVVAFSSNHHNQLRFNGKTTSTTLGATSSTSRRQLLQNAAAASLLINPTLANAIGAYQAEAGFDDFSNGLSMPKYNVDSTAPSLSAAAGGMGAPPQGKEVNPAKLEKLRAKQEAEKAKAIAKAEAVAKARAEAERKAAAKMEADAEKIRAKEEQRKRQLENMSEAQRAKIEAYEAQKADKKKEPSALDNMKRMYSL